MRTTASRRWVLPAGLVTVFTLMAVGLMLVLPSSASAHALLIDADPPVDARLAQSPAIISGSFSEPLDTTLSSMKVLDGAGETVSAADEIFDPNDSRRMSVEVGELEPGFYTVVWKTLSSIDGHLLKGSYPLTVLNPDGSEPTGPRFAGISGGVSGGEPTAETVVTKWLALTSAVVLVGGLAFATFVIRFASKVLPGEWKRRTREAGRRHLAWVAWPAIALLAAVGAAELVLQVRLLGGPEFIDEALDTFWGQRWIQRQFVLGAIAVALGASWWLRQRQREYLSELAIWTALAGGLGYLMLLSMISHAASLQGSFWGVASDFIHLVAAAVWIGMLAQLGLLLLWSARSVPEERRPVLLAASLQRFSAIAAVSVLLLLATGTFSALAEVSSPEGMLDTAYGRVLTTKLALVAVLLIVAGINAIVLRPSLLERAEERGRPGIESLSKLLTRTVWLEAGLAAAVLVVVAALIQYPTTVQEEAADEAASASAEAVIGFENSAMAGELELNMSVAPNEVGTNSFQVYVFPPPGEELVEILRVRLRFVSPDEEIGPSQAVAEQVAPNFFKVTGSFLTQPGDWEVYADIRRREVDDVSGRFTVPVSSPGSSGAGRFDFPLQAGSWAVVGSVGVLLASLILWVGVSQWPSLPEPLFGPVRIMRVASMVLGVALIAGVTTGFLEFTERETSGNPIKSTTASVNLGRELYTPTCSQCHGVNGRGDGPLVADLEIPPTDFAIHIPFHSDDFFFLVMSNGFGRVMPGFGNALAEEELWHILNFLQSEFSLEAQGLTIGGDN